MKATLHIMLLALVTLFSSRIHALPPEFTATYYAETYGMVVAQAKYILKHKKDGINFSQHSEPVGLAALFSDEALDESSELSLHNNQLLLDQYTYIQKGDRKNRNVQLNIKWRDSEDKKLAGTISGTASGNQLHLETSAPVWDTLSFQIPLMLNTRLNSAPQEHAILVKGDLKYYTFITHGSEEVSIKDHIIKTIKVERRDNKEDDPIYFWVAPELNNIPVKIEKWKKNKPRITMLLNEAFFPSDSSLQFQAGENSDDDFQ